MRFLPALPRPLSAGLALSLFPLLAGSLHARQEAAASPEVEAPEADAPADAEDEPAPPSPTGLPVKVQGTLPLDDVAQLTWRSVGPANMGGRCTDIAVHPTNPAEYWIGTATGGVVHTTNHGVTYEHQFTGQRVSSIGSIAVSTSNPDVVWVGTGEANPRNSVSWGNGLYRSLDGGETWDHRGLEHAFQVADVVIHPEDENVVYAAVLGRLWGPSGVRGLFKTVDGGDTWEQVLHVDEDTGVVEIAMQPGNPDVILAATYERRRDGYDSNDPARKWGAGSALWRSTDGGGSWTKLTGEGADTGLPTVTLGRIGVDFCASQPNVVFAVVETDRITQEPENAAYVGLRAQDAEVGARVTEVTEDGPAAAAGLKAGDVVLRMADRAVLSWDQMQTDLRQHFADETVGLEVVREGELVTLELTFGRRPQEEEDRTDELGYPNAGPFSIGLGGQRANVQDQQGPEGFQFGGVFRSDDGGLSWTRINSANPRPMYYSEIRVDPSDPQNLYLLGTRLYRSSDGGVTLTNDGHDGSVHVDHHALWIDPRDGQHMILGNDGGIYVTWDRMDHWDHHNHVALGQFYNIAVDHSPDYRIYGGLQDNGTWGGPNRVGNGPGPVNSDWMSIGGGDGFVVRVDPRDPNLVYYESQNGGMGRRHLVTSQGGFLRPRAGRGESLRFNWNTPFILSSHNPSIHYSAGNRVFRSLTQGEGARPISPDITVTERGSATALAESPRDDRILYVGTDDGGLWTTGDGGVTWVDLWTLNEGLEEEAEEPEAEPKASVASLPAAPDRGTRAQDPAPSDDPITGKWTLTASGEGIDDPEQGRFTLDLTLGEDGKVTGTIESAMGQGEIREGRFDAGTGKLRFAWVRDTFRIDFDATLDGGALEGDMTAAGGAFAFSFRGTREGGEPAEEPEEEPAADEAGEPAVDAPAEEEPAADAGEPEGGEDDGADEPREFLENTIDQRLPGRRYVSQLYPSAHDTDRVYAAFDGHRSDDDAPHAFVSEDQGRTWRSLTGRLPDEVGSVRALQEDLVTPDVLYLGAEFGCYVSLDRGQSWTRLNSNLPTVPVHDFAQHPTSGELIAGTHGRSAWVLDVSALRHMSEETLDADAYLYPVQPVVIWSREPSAADSGTRRFVGENPYPGARIHFSLDRRARDLSLTVERLDGETIATLDTDGDRGLHVVEWDLRESSPRDEDDGGRRRFRRGRRAGPGTYRVVLTADGERLTEELVIEADPRQPDARYITFEEEAEAREELFGEDEGPEEESGDEER